MLVLRQVHPDLETAKAALIKVRDTQMPDQPATRRSLRTWMRAVYRLLVFGGFMSPRTTEPGHGTAARGKAVLSVLVRGVVWVLTWVFPVTFMIAMAWGCETHTRQLGRRALVFYGGEAASATAAIAAADERHDRGHDARTIVRAIGLFLSVAIPIAFIAYVDHVRNTVGVNWLGALGALVALSLVIATAVISRRR